MAEGAGVRMVMGLGLVALMVLLAFIVERVAGTEQAAPSAAPSASSPNELEFCSAWDTLSSASSTDRIAEETDGPNDIREALVAMQELGFPAAMPEPARAGYLATLDRVEGELDPDYAPTAYPAEPREAKAFTHYLEVTCPT